MVQSSNASETAVLMLKIREVKIVDVFCYLTPPNTSAYCLYVYRCAQGVIFIGRKAERFRHPKDAQRETLT